MQSRARWPGLALLLAVAVALSGGAGAARADRGEPRALPSSWAVAQGQRVMVTTPSTGLHEMPAVVALRKGFYAEENLDVTRVQMAPPVAVAAVLPGEADYTIAVGSTVTAIVGADAPLKVVLGLATRPLQVVMTRDPGIQSVGDLRGRAVATSTLSDTTANLVRLALRAHGLEPQVDVSLQPLGESPNRLAALQTGQVSAVTLDLAHATEAAQQGARILLSPADLAELPTSGLGVTETKLRAEPQQVAAVIRASLRGTRFMRENRDETIALMMDHLGLTREAAETTYDLGIGSFAADGLISDQGLQLLIDAARETTGRVPSVGPAQVADFTLARRAAQ